MKRLYAEGASLYAAGQYSQAHLAFLQAADYAHQARDESKVAFDWNNAGSCSIRTMQFGQAFSELKHAQLVAETAHEPRPLIFALNSLVTLYIQMGQYPEALRTARDALDSPAGTADAGARARLLCEAANALAEMKRFDEGVPYYIEGLNGLLDSGDWEMSARVLGNFGNDGVTAGRWEQAEWALSEGFYLVRIHRLGASANILLGLARLRARQGRVGEAARLFQLALDAPAGPTPKWKVYAERGRFGLDSGDFDGALADYRAARRIITRMRADMVPADLDRITLESGLSEVMQGLVDAGNRVARKTGNRAVLGETFDAAEQDRLWSLRVLVPAPNDWRARLPEQYWQLLAQYQTLERTASAQGSVKSGARLAKLGAQLQQIEVSAAGGGGIAEETAESPLDHVKAVLDENGVLLSFHVSKTSSWLWAVDGRGVDVYPLPPAEKIEAETTAFARAVRSGAPSAKAGAELYSTLFGSIPDRYLHHTNWLLELDGPLYELPFAALVTGEDNHQPVYLMQRAVLQAVPGALLLKHDAIPPGGELLAVGDPIYNTADSRYSGKRGKAELTLARLPNTAAEIDACAHAWNSPRPTFLTGANAEPAAVEAAMARNPAIVHFATHVISGPGDFQSGLIALSLNSSGAMGLLGPKDIVARSIGTKLVVMNGCHSSQGQTLPSAGLMGLTRAWIGAGASAVLSTQWQVPDGEAQSLMTDFYRVLRAAPERGAAFALREAERSAIRNGKPTSTWAAYSLLSRMP